MNGVIIVLLAAMAALILFVLIVGVDRWLDEREQRAMNEEADRYARAVARLTALHQADPRHTRIGHREVSDDVR